MNKEQILETLKKLNISELVDFKENVENIISSRSDELLSVETKQKLDLFKSLIGKCVLINNSKINSNGSFIIGRLVEVKYSFCRLECLFEYGLEIKQYDIEGLYKDTEKDLLYVNIYDKEIVEIEPEIYDILAELNLNYRKTVEKHFLNLKNLI